MAAHQVLRRAGRETMLAYWPHHETYAFLPIQEKDISDGYST